MSDLSALLERVKAATGSDDRLNAELTCALWFKGLRPAEPDDFDGKYGYSPGNIKTEHGFLMARPYTRSVDEVLALLARNAPDLCVENLGEMAPCAGPMAGRWLAQLRPRQPRPRMSGPITAANVRSVMDAFETQDGETPALALLAALLAALVESSNLKQVAPLTSTGSAS